MTAAVLVAIVAAVVVGSALQRIGGMGLGLVGAPALSLLLGPVNGVLVTNVGTLLSSTLVMLAVFRDVDWRRYLQIGPLAVVGSVPGALLVREVPLAWLDVIVGGTVLLGLLLSARVHRVPEASGPLPAMVTGVVGGFMNTTSGVAGPAMTVYALAARWEQRPFAATLQPVFLTIGVVSIVTKVLAGAVPTSGLLPWWAWVGIAGGLLFGVGAGGRLAPIVGARRARVLTVVISVAGAAIALVRGLLTI